MMKKSIVSLSAAIALGGLAFAVGANAAVVTGNGVANNLALNPAGTGHMLFTPYYSAQDGNATFVNITNTDSTNGKAVKVRFRGAGNSDDVLDFTLYLSPGDVWSGMIAQDDSGYARLTTQDNSCTAPKFPADGVRFSNLRLPSSSIPDQAAATREGYLEVVEMADIVGDPAGTSNSDLYNTIKHVNNVPACDQATLNLYSTATAFGDPTLQAEGGEPSLGDPTGGLMGSWSIANLRDLGTYSGNMTAVAAYLTGTGAIAQNGAVTQAPANINYFPQVPTAIGSSIVVGDYTADPLLDGTAAPNGVTPLWFDLPDMSTPLVRATASDQVKQLQKALGKDSIYNEWAAASSPVAYGTDWVISQPTRRYYTAYDYKGGAIVTNGHIRNNPYASGTVCDTANGPQIGMEWTMAFTNREEAGVLHTSGPEFSPGNVTPPVQFCGEVALLAFGSDSVLHGTQTLQNVSSFGGVPAGGAGWGSMQVDGAPVVGFAASQFKTDANNNFGQTFPHRWSSPKFEYNPS